MSQECRCGQCHGLVVCRRIKFSLLLSVKKLFTQKRGYDPFYFTIQLAWIPRLQGAEEIFSYNRLRDVSDTRALISTKVPRQKHYCCSTPKWLFFSVCVIKRHVTLRPCMHPALRLDRSWTRNPRVQFASIPGFSVLPKTKRIGSKMSYVFSFRMYTFHTCGVVVWM